MLWSECVDNFGRHQSNETKWDLLSKIIEPKPVSGSEWIYLQRQFFIYENQGCDKCIRNTKPPYLPPLRGVHVSYDPKTSDYLCGFCVRSQLVPWTALFQETNLKDKDDPICPLCLKSIPANVALRQHPRIAKFINWIKKRPADYNSRVSNKRHKICRKSQK